MLLLRLNSEGGRGLKLLGEWDFTQEEHTKFDVKQTETLVRTTLEVVIVGKSPDVYS